MKQMEFDMEIEIKVPERPKVDKEMIEAAARKLVDVNATFDGCNFEEIADQYYYGIDGYELAKRLDDHYYWDIDAAMVSELDSMDGIVRDLWQEKQREWVNEFNIQPTLENGTHITKGVIDGVSTYHAACYNVKEYGCEKQNRYLIVKFEDAIPVEIRATKD